MLRRPPGEGRPVAQRKVLLALAVILAPWLPLVNAQQQQQQQQHHQPQQQHHDGVSLQQAPIATIIQPGDIVVNSHGERRQESPFEGDGVAGQLAATPGSQTADDSWTRDHTTADKNQVDNKPYPSDASALATLAPAKSVRAPISPRQRPSLLAGAGLSSLQPARRLENWEVEDYLLMATVEGHLYAVNRDSGDERWHLEVEQPMIETIQRRPNNSFADSATDPTWHPLDEYVWAVEPSQHGAIYVWTPSGYGSGVVNTGLTMKQLVDETPYSVTDQQVVYTGDKKTTLITIDAATGRVLKWFGQTGSQVDQSATCYSPNGRLLDVDSEACSDSGTFTLSRTEYTVTIHRLDGDGRELATLKFSEWGPNNFDSDLHQQYQSTHDNRYFTSQHDGKVYALDHPSGTSSFAREFGVPVARVFDIARPGDVPPGTNPELVLLPQPTPPARDQASTEARVDTVFLNQTSSGGWFAMSGWSYPFVVKAPSAWLNTRAQWDSYAAQTAHGEGGINAALVGVHSLGNARSMPRRPSHPVLGLPSGPTNPSPDDSKSETLSDSPSLLPQLGTAAPTIVDKVITLPQYAANRTLDFFRNPVLFAILCYLAYYYQRDIRRWWKGKTETIDYFQTPTFVQPSGRNKGAQDNVVPELTQPNVKKEEVAEVPVEVKLATDGSSSPDVPLVDPEVPRPGDISAEQQPADADSSEKKKKKTHRGRRAGKKHMKGVPKQQRENSDASGDNGAEGEPSIPGIQNIGMPPQLEPNVTTMSNNPEDVSGPIIKIGDIEVNQDEQLGMGSNGTVVFAGKFLGRSIAVKRMLTQFWDIATQETRLLIESDHHPNVIRYYAMSKNDSFLYIALQLCQASLSDIVDRPQLFPALARAGEMDLPGVLLQIADGLGFLHELRIIHRDLKPQNILVTMDRYGKPRLLVSDFGLCKKLEDGQSSFGATTAHAAGTSGWRAPELLLDDEAREHAVMTMASSHSDSSSQLVSSDVASVRRATRAIDIFSLGLVFFYVLTKGQHPFDCGDRYMREVNIRKGQFNLGPLDVLGECADEAKDLVEWMLQSNPRARPTAPQVRSHPFFWPAQERLAFLCAVSDHFELEPREPPSEALAMLEARAPYVCRSDFIRMLPKEFVESLGKQRKYTGTRLLDLLRALRNKLRHYGEMDESLKKMIGSIQDGGYLGFWARRFPNLLIECYYVVYKLGLHELDTFRDFFRTRKAL
ncbi:hypothetical protein GGR56DRAFT_621241 [Xylariaceae sp. FL0804]|nr:hypothetical protein GGR56DRAFT_621241 [Xylariaceae sp. FL0804]